MKKKGSANTFEDLAGKGSWEVGQELEREAESEEALGLMNHGNDPMGAKWDDVGVGREWLGNTLD